jgi:hypothetical protein
MTPILNNKSKNQEKQSSKNKKKVQSSESSSSESEHNSFYELPIKEDIEVQKTPVLPSNLSGSTQGYNSSLKKKKNFKVVNNVFAPPVGLNPLQ